MLLLVKAEHQGSLGENTLHTVVFGGGFTELTALLRILLCGHLCFSLLEACFDLQFQYELISVD